MAAEKIEAPALATNDSDSSRFAPHDTKNEGNAAVSEKNEIQEVSDSNSYLDPSNPFSDPDVAAYYANLYEKSQYECRHVFDPTLEWIAAEEKKLVRKLDWHACLWAVSLLAFPNRRLN